MFHAFPDRIRLKYAILVVAVLGVPVLLAAQHRGGLVHRSSTEAAVKENELRRSVHRRLDCSACHGHESGEMGFDEPDPVTTCADCHERAFNAWRMSVHADAFRREVPQAATCVACHGSHEVLAVADRLSPVSRVRVTEQTCARCHESPDWVETHSVPPDVVADYRRSFHGLSAALGDERVANCASCHSYHEILPSSDPASTTNERNLAQTCSACHAGANGSSAVIGERSFATGRVHRDPQITGFKIVDLVATMYTMMIALTVVFMFAHNAIDLYGRVRHRFARRRAGSDGVTSHVGHPVRTESGGSGGANRNESLEHKSYQRFTLDERIQHSVLAASFITLVVTGFALVFGWEFPLLDLQQGALLRGWLHRAAASVFIVLSVYHASYMVFTRRGRMNLRAFLPRLRSIKDLACSCAACFRLGPPSRADWRDLIQMAKYNLGFVMQPPAMGRFNYVEKLEYFGLVWGSIVMIITGLMLWFEVPFLINFPYWSIELAATVHYYEAILAALSIFVWHFYFTIFNPDVFPLSKTMITGDIDKGDMERDHALGFRGREAGCAEEFSAAEREK